MATFDVYNQNREKVSQVELDDRVFGAEVKEHLFWEVVRNQLANRRAGTAKVKTRSEVRGGGAKPFRQKGTGRARQGSSRAHHMVGGAVVHGPQPRDYSYTVPKKVRQQALCGALSLRAQNQALTILEDLELAQAKTKGLTELLDRFGLNKALIVDEENNNLLLSCRNLQNFQTLPPIGVNVFDVLRFDHLVLTRRAAEALVARLTRARKAQDSE
ncbi:MAG: 50S ribosomal protein L4 [Myxococcales bacterium]|nr:50S ribosomal protein L4 [Myxococcales bacterium]